jgi:hypothetical protein
MVRFFQVLDDLLSQIVPIAYLVGLAAGTILYFGGVIPEAPVAVGTCVGLAAECHYWLQQRRVRNIYGVLSRLKLSDPKREILTQNFKVQLAILILLGLFSAFNSNMFLSAFWHPLATDVPVWLQTIIRGSVVPLLLLATGALTPLHEDPSAYLTRASTAILRRTLRATVGQMKSRIRQARQHKADLVPIAVALMVDSGDYDGAKRLRLISEGISESEQDTGNYYAVALSSPDVEWEPPTGPGSPVVNTGPVGEPIHLPSRTQRRGKKGRTAAQATADAEATVRRLLARNPEMPLNTLMKRGHMSMKDAAHWRRVILSEGQYAQ